MRRTRLFFVLIVVLAASVACTSDNTAELQEAGEVSCVIDKVYTAPSGSTLTRLAPCSSETADLPVDGKVSTNSVGMGLIEIGQCQIYVFEDGEIKRSPCTESQEKSGTCLAKNSGLWKNECKNKVITTETADLELLGTWVWVTYLPEGSLTLVASFDGDVIATPREDDGGPGDQSTLAAGEFWFTADTEIGAIAEVEPRETQPIESLPALIDELRLTPWALSIERQAQIDGIDVRVPLVPEGTVNVTAEGGLFSEEATAEELLGGVFWSDVQAATEGRVSLFAPGFRAGTDVSSIATNFDRAAALVTEVGGVELTILADEASPAATAIVFDLAASFEEYGAGVRIEETDLQSARQQMASLVAEQQAVVLITGK